MITKDIYGKTLSNSFNSAIEASAQKVKPKITIDLLDSRHLSNTSFLYNYIGQAEGAVGSYRHYFSPSEIVNGKSRQSFPWAVAGALDQDGHVIRANGSYYTMPSSKTNSDDDYEFGWWTPYRSSRAITPSPRPATFLIDPLVDDLASLPDPFLGTQVDIDDASIPAGEFDIDPYLLISFDKTKMNKIVITTSEYYGRIESLTVRVINTDYGDLLNEYVLFENDEYKKEMPIASQLAKDCNYEANQILVTVHKTKYAGDYGRIQEINPIYEVDITDYVISYNVLRVRDVHDSSLPIGGAQTNTLNLTLDNTNKDWSVFNTSSTYGEYMLKDLKINVATGWRIKKTDDILSNTKLSQSTNSSNTVIYVDDTSIFPSGGAGDHFIATIDPDNENREIVLCNSISGNTTLNIESRGYANTSAKSHSVGATVQFDPYEYVPKGTFYVDEWKASTSNMTVEVTASDWSKFLNETTITRGYLLQNTTIGNAVKYLLMKRNFPKSNIKLINRYFDDAVDKNCFSIYSFRETSTSSGSSNMFPVQSLEMRLWAMTEGNESSVKDIASFIKKPISESEAISGSVQQVTPDKTVLLSDININKEMAIDIKNLSFDDKFGNPRSTYFNGVIEGYYIPYESGQQNLNLFISNGGARIYLRNVLVAERWIDNPPDTLISTNGYYPSRYPVTYDGEVPIYSYMDGVAGFGVPTYLDLVAGRPYPIRIEFFHTDSPNSFSMSLYTQKQSDESVIVSATSVRNTVPRNTAALGSPRNTAALGSFLTSTQLTSAGLGAAAQANSDPDYEAYDYYVYDGVYVGNVLLNQTGGIESEPNNRGAYLQDNGYIRIPTSSVVKYETFDDFTYEIVAKFNNGGFSGDGEYISSFANSSPLDGVEFFYNTSNTHGAKVVTNTGVVTISSNTALSNSEYTFITLTYKYNGPSSNASLKYYINGQLQNTVSVSSVLPPPTRDYTIGGRGSSYSSGEVAPASIRSFYIDEFIKYKNALSDEQIKERYVSANVEQINVFPFLFGNDITYRAAIDEVTLAELGRFYIDENDNARYEGYKTFFEPVIDQHANVQYTISDTSHIISSDLNVQLQANKVTVNLSKLNTGGASLQALWKPDGNTFLRAISIQGGIDDQQTSLVVKSTSDLAFPNSGYFIIDNEIIKYGSKTENTFNNLKRGFFNTTAASHSDGALLREVRYYQAKYDKSPAFNVKIPLITAQFRADPDLVKILKFQPSSHSAEVIIAATEAVGDNSFAIIEGTDETGLPWGMSIAGKAVVVSDSNSTVGSDSLTDISEEITASIKKYGLKEIKIENIFISDNQFAEKLVDFIISKLKDPVPIIQVESIAIPKIQLGDRIRISSFDAFDIINGDFWVVSHSFSYGKSLNHSLTLRKVV